MTDTTVPRDHPSWHVSATASILAHVVVTNHHELSIGADLRIWLDEIPAVWQIITYREQFLGPVILQVDDVRDFQGPSPGFGDQPNCTIYAHIVR